MAEPSLKSMQGTLDDESFMSAADLRAYMTKMQMSRAQESVAGMSGSDKAREDLVKELMKPIDLTPERIREIVRSVTMKLKDAAESGKTELMVMRFPNSLCTDKGRAVNNLEPDWPDTLIGRPRQAYELWRDHLRGAGFRISAMIIAWPGGLPGDVGLFLNWGEVKK